MIVYIASFPRSGNFWLQTLIGNQLKRITTRLSSKKGRVEVLDRWIIQNKKYYDIVVEDLASEESGFNNKDVAGWLSIYHHPSDGQRRKALLPGCGHLINNVKTREMLADDREQYFVKSHALPFANYFAGERVVQVVRNPGASIWSYYNFKKDIRDFRGGLSDLITGEVKSRDWSFYHSQWMETAGQIGDHYMFVRYEDMFNKELEFCDKLGSWLGVPVLSRDVRPFHHYHAIRPSLTRKGKASEWEVNFSREQMHQLWTSHKDLMRKYEYPEPNYEIASDGPIDEPGF